MGSIREGCSNRSMMVWSPFHATVSTCQRTEYYFMELTQYFLRPRDCRCMNLLRVFTFVRVGEWSRCGGFPWDSIPSAGTCGVHIERELSKVVHVSPKYVLIQTWSCWMVPPTLCWMVPITSESLEADAEELFFQFASGVWKTIVRDQDGGCGVRASSSYLLIHSRSEEEDTKSQDTSTYGIARYQPRCSSHINARIARCVRVAARFPQVNEHYRPQMCFCDLREVRIDDEILPRWPRWIKGFLYWGVFFIKSGRFLHRRGVVCGTG